MKKFFLFIVFIMSVMIASRCGMKVKSKALSFDWKRGGLLPPAAGAGNQPGVAGAIAGVHNDVLLVAGGANFPDSMPWMGGKKKYHTEVYAFRKNEEENLEFFARFQLPSGLAYSASCSTPTGVVFCGGENENGLSNKAGLLKEKQDRMEIENLPDLPLPVSNASICVHKNMLYLAGGETSGEAVQEFLLLDLDDRAKGWQPLASLPQPTSHAVMIAADDAIYLMGGRKKNKNGISDLYSSVYEYNFKQATWRQKKSLPYALSAGTGVLLDDGVIFLFGGDKGETFHQTEKLIAAINSEKDSAKKEELNRQKIKLQSTHQGFSREVLSYNLSKDEWKHVGNIPFTVPVTTSAIRWGDCVVIPSGEIKAGVRSSEIILGKRKTG